jgi:hypothetical protein
MLCLSYYCLYSLFNKIRDRAESFCLEARWWRAEGGKGGRGAEMAQTLYAHMNKWKKER